jgi:hypothetical protein
MVHVKGLEDPFCKEVYGLALRLANAFFLVRCMAWDIVVAKSRVHVIEGNNPWNRDIQEVYDRGLWSGVFAKEAARTIINGPPKSSWW